MSSTQALPAEAPWIPPGVIRLVRLKREGALGRGDLVATRRLGTCEVVSITSAHSLTVRALDNHSIGKPTVFTLIRHGRLMQVTVTPRLRKPGA